MNERFTKQYLVFLGIFLLARSVSGSYPYLEYALKPLILLQLGWAVYHNATEMHPTAKKLLLTALFFSWIGDVSLMFKGGFLIGLGAFLLAHLAYIALFARDTPRFQTRFIVASLGIAAYSMGLFSYLRPHLGGLQLPVLAYSMVIMTMLLYALHRQEQNFNWILIGAVLFVLSDSILAVNKFATPVPAGGIWVMLTYALGQFFLCKGSLKGVEV
jgi:uncharacterized membrane protein YhhN